MTAESAASPSFGALHVVLLGSGRAHLHLLSTLAAHSHPGVQVTLVTPYQRQVISDLVPEWVAGHYALEDCAVALEPLLLHTGVRWLQRQAAQVHAGSRTVTLDDGTALAYDCLSINTGAIQNRELLERRMPGVREHGLFVRPSTSFVTLWPSVAALGDARALRIAVIGAGASGFEIAMAVRHRLPKSAVTLITGVNAHDAVQPSPLRNRLQETLRAHQITVLPDKVTAVSAGSIQLGCGAQLACDVPLIATGLQPPVWLAASGFALDAQGFLAVDACQRSASHPEVFACGDVSGRADASSRLHFSYGQHAGPTLARNLASLASGGEPQGVPQVVADFKLISCGDRRAIGFWREHSALGRWPWWLKHWIDRRMVLGLSNQKP